MLLCGMFLSLYSILRLVEQHLKRDLCHLLLHGLIYHGEIMVQHRVDVSPHRTGGVGVLVEVERTLVFFDRMKDIKK